jgi:hypothetical protein
LIAEERAQFVGDQDLELFAHWPVSFYCRC